MVWLGVLSDAAVALLLFSLVFLPDARRVAGLVFENDLFYHWDHFVMAQALAHRHGMALPLDVYAPYGLGWPTLVSGLAGAGLRLSHEGVIALAAAFLGLYYALFYGLLRVAVSSRLLALSGALLLLWLDFFSPLFVAFARVATPWQWPSMLALRAPFDGALFLALLVHARSRRPAAAVVAGALLAASLFFATDTGLMLVGVFVVYWSVLLLFGVGPDDGRAVAATSRDDLRPGRALGLALAAFAVVLGGGLLASTHGRVLFEPAATLAAWIGGMTNAIGASARLFDAYLAAREPGLLLATGQLGVCLFAVVLTASRALHRRLDPTILVLGCVGLYGVGRLLFFAWNSEPLRTRLPAFATAILLTVGAARLLAAIERRLPSSREARAIDPRRLGSAAALLATAVLLLSSPTFAIYPNLWHAGAIDDGVPLAPLLPDRGEILVAAPVARTRGEGLRTAIEEVAALARAGEPVAVLDSTKTFIYVEADAAPWSGDAALFMNTWTLDEARDLVRRFEETGPAWVLVRREVPPGSLIRDTWMELRRSLARRYRTVKRLRSFDLLHCESCGTDHGRSGGESGERGESGGDAAT
jgi:hypothetical protein